MTRLSASITLDQASRIVDGVLESGNDRSLAPLTAAVLDAGGNVVALKRADGSGILRAEVALAKAYGVLAMGWSAHALVERAQALPQFFGALGVLAGGRMLPVAGGVPILDDSGTVLGAVGVSGDTSENDEACAVEAIGAVGLRAWLEPGEK